MKDFNFLIIGNGLDIALGMETSINSFNLWVDSAIEKQLNKLKISQQNIISFNKFKNSYKEWCISMNKINNYWNELENNIIDFFSDFKEDFQNFKRKCKGKWKKSNTAYIQLRTGYEIFTYLMQFYYVNKVKNKISTKKGKVTHTKLKRLEDFFNLKIKAILSLNYTNLEDFEHGNTKEKINIKKVTIYYLHYIALGLNFDQYLRSLDLKNGNKVLNYAHFGDAQNIFEPQNIKIEKETRLKYSSPLFLRNTFCRYCQKLLTGKKQYYQFLILGNTYEGGISTTKDYSFLEKNENDNLFLKNYPKFILNEIKYTFKKVENGTFYIFGYSWGNADYFFNNFLASELKKDVWKIKYIFFDEDKGNKELIIQNMTFFNKFSNKFDLNLSFNGIDDFNEVIEFI